MRELDIRHSCFSVFRVFRFHRPGNICDTCNTSPVIGVIRARAYTSIREVLSQALQDGTNENYKPSGAAKSICIYIEHKNGPRPELREQPSLLDGSHFQHSLFQLRT